MRPAFISYVHRSIIMVIQVSVTMPIQTCTQLHNYLSLCIRYQI